MPNPTLTGAIDRLASGEDLPAEEAAAVLREIMEGRSSEAETAAVLIALRAKGETVAELVGLARTMRSLATRVEVDRADLLDTAGTGGGHPTFNVSTTAAFVAAGAGCTVAKHGNRSATGRSGSADVLEALGARIDLEPAAVAECIEGVGFGFMFAPAHHAAMKHVVPVRKALAVRTIFNFLGPLTNPAGATRQLIGVSDPSYMDTIGAALAELGADRALVVSSEDGLDEIGVSGPTRAVELRDGRIEGRTITPEELGVEPAPADSIGAGEPHESAALARKVLDGEPGADRSIVVLNAAAAIYVGGGADTLEQGARAAEQAIDSGAAREAMERFVARTKELAPA
ncbi:MAG: anthranilate phosphoribosyltransferase [Actinomycetota bacterium]|nr:anthranilate phosphoribosyltransferase [Actinomycetota bacterium]